MSQTLLVNTDDFAEVALVNMDEDTLAGGCIRLKVGPWALTANNVTYMLTGDQIGYWHYFNPSDYDIHMDETDGIKWGRMPVWGYGEVTQSNCADVKVGQLLYGFLPVADSFDMRPVKLTPHGFQDGMAHRTKLHSLYNSYTFVDSDPSFGVHQDKERGAVPIAALTSERNESFTKGTDFYDRVYTYDTITDMNPDIKTVIVDMAGNGDVMETVGQALISAWAQDGSPFAIAPRAGFQLKKVRA